MRRQTIGLTACTLATVTCFVGCEASQTPQHEESTAIGRPLATFHHGFTRVEGIRELRDGRVIVLDVLDHTVQLIDAAWEEMRQIGREGSGPAEYRYPTKLFALPGDSTAVLDDVNGRMMVITPDAAPGGFLGRWGSPPSAPGEESQPKWSATGIFLHGPEAADGRGHFYAPGPAIAILPNGDLVPCDSAAIERWAQGSKVRDTVGYWFIPLPGNCRVLAGSVACRPDNAGKPRAFGTANQWAIAPDGRLAVVYWDPYHVRFTDTTGQVWNGPPIPYEPVRVTEGHKGQWRERWQRPTIGVRVLDDQRSTFVFRQDELDWEWPEYLKPFLYPAVRFASDGMLWVKRTTPAEEPPTFDVIGETGQVVQQVSLPHSTRLVGFGENSLYLVRIDEVDLQYLEKYELPRTGGP